MKKRFLLGLVVAVVVLTFGIMYGTAVNQEDSILNMNLEALSLVENDGKLQCHPIDLFSGRLWYNTTVCLNDTPGHCTYPHSALVSDGTQDCFRLN